MRCLYCGEVLIDKWVWQDGATGFCGCYKCMEEKPNDRASRLDQLHIAWRNRKLAELDAARLGEQLARDWAAVGEKNWK